MSYGYVPTPSTIDLLRSFNGDVNRLIAHLRRPPTHPELPSSSASHGQPSTPPSTVSSFATPSKSAPSSTANGKSPSVSSKSSTPLTPFVTFTDGGQQPIRVGDDDDFVDWDVIDNMDDFNHHSHHNKQARHTRTPAAPAPTGHNPSSISSPASRIQIHETNAAGGDGQSKISPAVTTRLGAAKGTGTPSNGSRS